MEAGIRDLKDNLSHYIRQVEAGERVVVTANGRPVAELVRPFSNQPGRLTQFDQLIASGLISAPLEGGDPLEDCPEIRLPAGSAASLIDFDRDES